MAKKTPAPVSKATRIDDETDLMDEGEGSPSLALDTNATGSMVQAAMGASLVQAGQRINADLGALFDEVHAGGSLPLINWTREGQAFVGVFVEREGPIERTAENPGREFAVLVFDVIDPVKLARNPGDLKGAIMSRAQLISGTALEPYFTKAKPGTLVKLTYQGEVATSRGQSKMKLVTVSELTPKRKPA